MVIGFKRFRKRCLEIRGVFDFEKRNEVLFLFPDGTTVRDLFNSAGG